MLASTPTFSQVRGAFLCSGTRPDKIAMNCQGLRYRLLHTAARLVRGQRKRKIRIPETWPWARELEACFLTVFALPPPA
jgi:hypothetical protein